MSTKAVLSSNSRSLNRRAFLTTTAQAAGLARRHAPEKRAVMVFDTPCRVENDPTGEVRQIMEKRGGASAASFPGS